MSDSKTYRHYAEQCRRLAKQMKPEHRAVLLEIADAWTRCADEAEGARRDGDGEDQVWHPWGGPACGGWGSVGPPPSFKTMRSMVLSSC